MIADVHGGVGKIREEMERPAHAFASLASGLLVVAKKLKLMEYSLCQELPNIIGLVKVKLYKL
jgi:hypothetical protein